MNLVLDYGRKCYSLKIGWFLTDDLLVSVIEFK